MFGCLYLYDLKKNKVRMPTRLIIMCMHAHGDESGHLDLKGVEQSHSLGRRLSDLMDSRKLTCACVLTSSLAKETGGVVKTHLHTPCLVDSHLDEYSAADSYGFLRILMAVWNALEVSSSDQCVVLITHSYGLHRCARLFGKIPFRSAFRAMPLASIHLYEFPFHKVKSVRNSVKSTSLNEVQHFKPGMWYCETGDMFNQKKKWVSLMTGMVDKMWSNAPVPTVGPVEVFLDSDDWLVETDVWAMRKWNVRSKIVMAISNVKMADGLYLRCLRDLLPEHVHALKKLDKMFPDGEWVKYITYPPFVWRLHVHIQGKEAPLPYKNTYLLKDVICSLEMSKGSQDFIVWMYG